MNEHSGPERALLRECLTLPAHVHEPYGAPLFRPATAARLAGLYARDPPFGLPVAQKADGDAPRAARIAADPKQTAKLLG